MAEFIKKFMESFNDSESESNAKDGGEDNKNNDDSGDPPQRRRSSGWDWGAKEKHKKRAAKAVEDGTGQAIEEDEAGKDNTKILGKWDSFFSNLMSDDNDKDNDGTNDALGNVLSYVVKSNEGDKDEVSEGKSVKDLIAFMELYGNELKRTGEKYMGDIEVTNLNPPSLFYFLEKEEERKTPSWKCRKHRFYPKLKVEDVVELNTYFHYADLAYTTDYEQVKEDLSKAEHGGDPYDVVHFKGDSQPYEPGYYVAVKRGTAEQKDKCQLLLSIRGTASVMDIITDCLCESLEYRKGQAHSGILKSGQYIVKEFDQVLQQFCKDNNVKGHIEVLVVGHSLGGGAACVVGMELQGIKNLNVKVVGFGTPGCMSKELGESADYITTVVCDSDAIPRTSGENAVNALLSIMEYDWIEKGKLDAELAVADIQKHNSWFISESMRDKTLARINKLLDEEARAKVKKTTTERMKPILFPPGECIHLWRDGNGISGNIVPGSFFDELDISRTMVDDHLSKSGYGAIFLQLMRQQYDDPHLRMETLLEKQKEEERKPLFDFAGWKW